MEDAIQRDLTTARRATLLEILWHERYLTRAQIMTRVGLRLGKDCFGVSAWEDTFYRDMHVVKHTFRAVPAIHWSTVEINPKPVIILKDSLPYLLNFNKSCTVVLQKWILVRSRYIKDWLRPIVFARVVRSVIPLVT